MIPAARAGVVELAIGSTVVPLRFTWAAIDGLGRDGVGDRFRRIAEGAPAGLFALGELIAAASGDAITTADVIHASPPVEPALAAVVEAWLLALHGPAATAEEREGPDPPPAAASPNPTWWPQRWKLRSAPASTRPASSPRRPG